MSFDLAVWHADQIIHEFVLLEVAVCTAELEVRHFPIFELAFARTGDTTAIFKDTFQCDWAER